MDAIIRVFKHVNGLPEREGDGKVPGATFCSIRFLVASTQAINLIGKQGSSIKSIQESTGASIRYNTQASQERQVETWAEKSLLHSTSQIGMGANYPLAVKRDPLFHDRETQFESNIHSSVISLYGQDLGLSGMRSSGLGRASGPFETQVAKLEFGESAGQPTIRSSRPTNKGGRPTFFSGLQPLFLVGSPPEGLVLEQKQSGSLCNFQRSNQVQTEAIGGIAMDFRIAQTMQIPLSYAEDIIGIGGANIAYIRRTSGAILSVQDEITVHHHVAMDRSDTKAQIMLKVLIFLGT
ncbi:hypothetical protein HYC85_017082 [Camellia sinensis]|uniref:K Homology domain-containing protein n=1 Tax=Camellia sinensis TaxID=4442 RepID=A0A7J7H4R8_CAMSI|nr:hypothetical protein HYC85_017082 [Camellia sinensis]